MDYEKLVSCQKGRACIISVEKYSDGSYGNIRIVTANKAHIDDAEQAFHRQFVPDSPYYYYFPQDKLCVSRMKECMQIRMNIMHSIPSGNTDNNVMR